jgi:hydroxymethylpyrimidine/phosphomethylpyrimidine kinase
VEPEAIRSRLDALVEDFKARADKTNGIVPDETVKVVRTLLDAAKQALPDDPVVQAVQIPGRSTYSDLYPTLRQVVLALPQHIGIA